MVLIQDDMIKIEGSNALAVYGNYVDELFSLRQNGASKARGELNDPLA